ncbi:hypothetical protein MY4824_003431 [Beauveria thailandica]
MACLDIPIPKNVARLVQKPPFCRPRIEDIQVLDLIREFGQRLARPSDEIEQALNLASGPSDVMIILERPRLTHPFSASFDAFVQDCDTLQAVDELVQFASNGTRSIHTVTVVDAYPFKPHLGNKLARLCLRWRDYQHPRKDEIQTRLIDLGSEQEWFQTPDANDYQSPDAVGYRVGFADEAEEELANELRSLEIDGIHLADLNYDEEEAFWSNRERSILSNKKKLKLWDELSDTTVWCSTT